MFTGRGRRIAALALCLGALSGGAFAIASASQAAATLPALAGHWAMDEGSGTTTADSSGNGNTADLGSGASWSTGPGGAPAIALNGTSAGIVPIFKPVVNTAQSFTVSVWVKLNNTAGWQTVVSMDGTYLSGFYLQLNASSGKFEFIRYTSDSPSSAIVQANSGVAPVAASWYHLVGVDDVSTGQLEIYVNGTEDGTAPYTSAWQDTGDTLIGRGQSGGQPTNFVNGVVSDVQLYQAALTSAQVDALNGTPVGVTAATSGTGSGTATVSDSNPVAACSGATKCLTYVGDSITVTPSAAAGSRFTGWSGVGCAGTTDPCTFAAASTGTATATFAKQVTISTACVADEGDAITITPTAASGPNRFTGWSGGSCTTTENPCKLTAGASGETDTATFAKEVTIATAVAGTGSGTATITDAAAIAGCANVTSCVADEGDAITITPTAASGPNRFTGWSGGSCTTTENPCKLT
ncbi:MAG: LamG domain-containing protein, partial [Solirubrobacteraceae bacterium]